MDIPKGTPDVVIALHDGSNMHVYGESYYIYDQDGEFVSSAALTGTAKNLLNSLISLRNRVEVKEPDNLATITARTKQLIEDAEAVGVVVKIDTKALKPLRMGNYVMVPEVYPRYVRPE